MTRDEFLLEMDEILGLPAGTLRGQERLEDLQNWDSTTLITLITLAETNNGVNMPLHQIVGCSTVADILRLAKVDGSCS